MIGVVAFDAGGAELVSSYLRRNDLEFIACVDGPAIKVFERKFGAFKEAGLEELVASVDWVLCSTSFPSDLEWQAFGLARQAGKKSTAFLDHWVNYRQRFIRNGKTHYPDELWVADADALRIAEIQIPELQAKVVGNPYFEDLKDLISKYESTSSYLGGKRILYICEPIFKEFQSGVSADEKEALIYFLDNISSLGVIFDEITIRPHPRETEQKYEWVLQSFDLPIRVSARESLVEQVTRADVVVGCNSMALVVGLLAKKRVVSAIPPGDRPFILPFKQIEILSMSNSIKPHPIDVASQE
jgi:hypothetical protein